MLHHFQPSSFFHSFFFLVVPSIIYHLFLFFVFFCERFFYFFFSIAYSKSFSASLFSTNTVLIFPSLSVWLEEVFNVRFHLFFSVMFLLIYLVLPFQTYVSFHLFCPLYFHVCPCNPTYHLPFLLHRISRSSEVPHIFHYIIPSSPNFPPPCCLRSLYLSTYKFLLPSSSPLALPLPSFPLH